MKSYQSPSTGYNLNPYQLEAILKLNKFGVTEENVRQQHWIVSKHHFIALGYLLSIKHYTFNAAVKELATLNKMEATAIYYDLSPQDFLGLETHSIQTLIQAKQFQGLQNKNDVLQLNKTQIEIIKKLYSWGVTSNLIRKYQWLNTNHHINAITYLIKHQFDSFEKAINEIENLKEHELLGMSIGLKKTEIHALNSYQIFALAECHRLKNQVLPQLFINKAWFNSEAHVGALIELIKWREFTIEKALLELDRLDSYQAALIKKGESRDNIVGLNEWMLAAIKKHHAIGLEGKHLRNKKWFNSKLHLIALNTLIQTDYFFQPEKLTLLEKMNDYQLGLIARKYSPEAVAKLTPIQVKLLAVKFRCVTQQKEIIAATWLKTKEQYDVFILLNDRYHLIPKNVLKILEKVSKEHYVNELLAALNEDLNNSKVYDYDTIMQLNFSNDENKNSYNRGYRFFDYQITHTQPTITSYKNNV